MSSQIRRRTFLRGLGCSTCAAALAGRFPQTAAAQAQSFDQLDKPGRLRLADMALDLARRRGATHADVRIGRTRWQSVSARDRRPNGVSDGISHGLGVRVLIDGLWGFAAAEEPEDAAVRRAVDAAAENAGAMRQLGTTPIVLEPMRAYHDDWTMPMRIDPFTVSDADKIGLLLAVNDAALKAGASFSTAYIDIVKEERFFASSVGSQIDQARIRLRPGFDLTVVDKSSGRFAGRSSLAAPRAAGWDYVLGLNLADEAARAAPEAREKLAAKSVEPGRYDLVIDATNLWLTLHESVGHSTELDRALGWEAGYAGTSFVTPDKRGSLRFGSELMTVTAERDQAGGLASVGYDDDGVKPVAFTIVRGGIFEMYQMAIGQPHLIGEASSNGCAYGEHAASFPIQRMPNVSLQPNPKPSTLDDLIGGVDNGIYIVGDGSWSIDQQRYNFQFGGQLFYEIKNGKRGTMLRDVAYQAQTPAFWNALDGLGDQSTHFLGGTFWCGKGEPGQSAPVSHGAAAGRFRNINVLNTDRSDI
ncbi:MAG: TldD/PmbA family protein [Alphaproteobacteria bacterium]|nr:TldD/PmbA family protein [Alphaproteobacteria bacterium]